MNSKVMKVIGFGVSVLSLFATEFIVPAITEKAEQKKLEELVDNRIKLITKEDANDEK